MAHDLPECLPSALLRHAPLEDIPASRDLLDREELDSHLTRAGVGRLSMLVVGDIMLGGRSGALIRRFGAGYPFHAVRPLLRRAYFSLGNLEGPLAREATKQDRRHSYRVQPGRARALRRAGVHMVTLANNHLTDCGRQGVVETLAAVQAGGLDVIGAGLDRRSAHQPAIRRAGDMVVGCLGYYWNRRTAATDKLPGSARATPEHIEADLGALRGKVDRIVVTFHCGVPYQRAPLPEDRELARLAVDLGADAVVGHHTHVVQPFEIHRGRPIFYDVGNFTFGSGNSRGEGLALGLRFLGDQTQVTVVPLYVKNRDPRVNYQPKVLRGEAAQHVLCRLAELSGEFGPRLQTSHGVGHLTCMRSVQ